MSVHENSMQTVLPEFYQGSDNPFFETNFAVSSPENIFSIFEALDGASTSELDSILPPLNDESSLCQQEGDNQQLQTAGTNLVSEDSTFAFNANPLEYPCDTELDAVDLHKNKKQKLAATGDEVAVSIYGQQKVSHITVERNRRKQMNENLSILRSLMPSFYVKRVLIMTSVDEHKFEFDSISRHSNMGDGHGQAIVSSIPYDRKFAQYGMLQQPFALTSPLQGDQASIVGGVVDYITELQQVLQSLEAKKQRKVYSEVLSPRLISSPRNLPSSPRKPPLSPRLIPSLPVSPRTPTSPYKHHSLLQLVPYNFSPTILSPSNSSFSSPIDCHNAVATANELVAHLKSGIADVEVKFSGPHVLLKTVSAKIPGQALKIIVALEDFSLQILHISLSTTDDAMIISFTIKIGIECQLSADDLALHVQQTFC